MIALDPVSEPLNRTPHKAAAFPSADRARSLVTLAEIRLQIVREAESGMALVENAKSSMPAPEEIMREAGRLHNVFNNQTYNEVEGKKRILTQAAQMGFTFTECRYDKTLDDIEIRKYTVKGTTK